MSDDVADTNERQVLPFASGTTNGNCPETSPDWPSPVYYLSVTPTSAAPYVSTFETLADVALAVRQLLDDDVPTVSVTVFYGHRLRILRKGSRHWLTMSSQLSLPLFDDEPEEDVITFGAIDEDLSRAFIRARDAGL